MYSNSRTILDALASPRTSNSQTLVTCHTAYAYLIPSFPRGYFVKIFNAPSPCDPSTTPDHVPFMMPGPGTSIKHIIKVALCKWWISEQTRMSFLFFSSPCNRATCFVEGEFGIGLKCSSDHGAALIVSQSQMDAHGTPAPHPTIRQQALHILAEICMGRRLRS
jgi:hypothetical protein